MHLWIFYGPYTSTVIDLTFLSGLISWSTVASFVHLPGLFDLVDGISFVLLSCAWAPTHKNSRQDILAGVRMGSLLLQCRDCTRALS